MPFHLLASSLLTLPHELLSEIIDLVVSSTRAPPTNPEDLASSERFEDTQCVGWFGDNLVERDPNPASYRPTCQGLLLTNRQLHIETLASIERTCAGVSYALDVMLDNEQKLLPTWTFVPKFSRHVNTVTATMRIFGSSDKRKSMFRGGCGGPPLISWSFYNVLERFLRVGPVGKLGVASSKVDRGVTIESLEIDVLTPPNQSTDSPLCVEDSINDSQDGTIGKSTVKRPEHLLQFLSFMIGVLCHMDYYTAEYGKILFERVGQIKLKIDGVVKEEFDLANILAQFPAEGPWRAFDKIEGMDWRQWRQQAIERRERAGLPLTRLEREEENKA